MEEEQNFNAEISENKELVSAEIKPPAEVAENNDMLSTVIEQNARATTNVKETIDLLSTKKALEQEGTVETLVTEKTEELKNDAIAKRVQAETEKIRQEVEKVRQEGEKEIAELTKERNRLQAEVEAMEKEADKAEAYFQANKDILKCAGITSKKTLSVMKTWMWMAGFIFILIQIIKLPVTIIGGLVEGIIDIIGGICGVIKNNALKITVSLVVILILIAAFIGIGFGGKAIGDLIGSKNALIM